MNMLETEDVITFKKIGLQFNSRRRSADGSDYYIDVLFVSNQGKRLKFSEF
jgi:hypothetical protein